ncbi:hypothetical protein [Euzebya tangerina]|uniref:hypothetical protein n=1 Tax=Euzebya tangerina TaxID=591198 RepID=UPI0013C2BBC2|nr:hypothetical protein [Euzebya tangerina]
MRVFVLGAGRTGSTSLARACQHMTNYTAGHESHRDTLGPSRLDYPDNHIEVDNRLSWYLGRLYRTYGDQAAYVHLRRDPALVARSFVDRWRPDVPPLRWRIRRALTGRFRWNSLIDSYAYGVLQRNEFWPDDQRPAVARDLVETIEGNVTHFLHGVRHALEIDINDGPVALRRLWDFVGAEGDFDRAAEELMSLHNAGPPAGLRT